MTTYASLNYTSCPCCPADPELLCDVCSGDGVIPLNPCHQCHGVGQVFYQSPLPFEGIKARTCVDCDGTGCRAYIEED